MLFCIENNNYPKLRFKNSNSPWENNIIENLFKITRGYVLDKKTIQSFETKINKYPVYSSQTLNKGLMGYFKEYLFENAITWTTDGANAGTVNYRNHKFYCTNVCGVLYENKIKPSFYLSLILNKEFKKYVVKELGNPKLMNNIVSKINVKIPHSEKEANKLNLFFITINKNVENALKYIKFLKLNKKYYIKKLFI